MVFRFILFCVVEPKLKICTHPLRVLYQLTWKSTSFWLKIKYFGKFKLLFAKQLLVSHEVISVFF